MPLDKPSSYADWATQEETSPAGRPNKATIPEQFRLSGLKEEQPLARQYHNEQMNLVGEWVRYLEDQIIQLSTSASAAVINTIFPVGAIYITDQDQDPSITLGIGTWSRIEGRFLVGRDLSDTDFDGIGETGGSKEHSHTNSLVTSSAGSHSHTIPTSGYGSSQTSGSLPSPTTFGNLITGSGKSESAEALESLGQASTTQSTGSAGEHTHTLTGGINTASNLPPYRSTNIFRRIS